MNFLSLTNEMKEKVIKSMEKRTPKGLSKKECWIWEGRVNWNGYGQLTVGGKCFLAHRVAWEMHWQIPIPPTMFCCHTCDVRDCSNPHHLVLGTCQTNAQDMMDRDRKIKFKRHQRLELADAIVGGMGVEKAASKFGLKIRTLLKYLKCSDVVAKYGKVKLPRAEWLYFPPPKVSRKLCEMREFLAR